MFTGEVAVIGCENDDRVVPNAKIVELIENPAYPVVNKAGHCKIRADDVAFLSFGFAVEAEHFVEHTVAFGNVGKVELALLSWREGD